MIEETLPLRRQQLYSTYGPGGPDPLVPATQDVDVVVTLGATGGTGKQAFLELLNAQPVTVDISGWKLGGAAHFTFRPGAARALRRQLQAHSCRPARARCSH
jgi:hypothetical protein